MADERERIDVKYDYALCAWARHFNVSEHRVKQAVAAVGDRADRVRQHLAGERAGDAGAVSRERPSSR